MAEVSVGDNSVKIPDKKTPTHWAEEIIKTGTFLLFVLLIISVIFGYSPLLSLWYSESVILIWRQSVPIIAICTIGIGIVFFYIIKKIENTIKKESTNFLLTKSEVQQEKIREWALKHHGLYLEKCVLTGTSPPVEAGEASAFPHTKHYCFEIIKNGIIWNYAHIKNPTFKRPDIYELVKIGNFYDTPTHYWYGEPRTVVPMNITQTSAMARGIKVGGMSDDDEEDEDSITG